MIKSRIRRAVGIGTRGFNAIMTDAALPPSTLVPFLSCQIVMEHFDCGPRLSLPKHLSSEAVFRSFPHEDTLPHLEGGFAQ